MRATRVAAAAAARVAVLGAKVEAEASRGWAALVGLAVLPEWAALVGLVGLVGLAVLPEWAALVGLVAVVCHAKLLRIVRLR